MKYSVKRLVALVLSAMLLLQSVAISPAFAMTALASADVEMEAEVQEEKQEEAPALLEATSEKSEEAEAPVKEEPAESKEEVKEEAAPEEKAEEAAPAEEKAEAVEEEKAEEKSEPASEAEEVKEEKEEPKAEEKSEAASDAEKAEDEKEAEAEEKSEEKSEEKADDKEEAAPAEEVKEENEASEEKPAEEEVLEEKPEESTAVAMPEKLFMGRADKLSVVVYAEEGTFPEGTEMKVTSVSESAVMGAVKEAVGDAEVVSVRAADISFYYTDPETGKEREIQPLKPVRVSMKPAGMDDEKDHQVLHIDDNGNADVVVGEGGMSGAKASFGAGSFSIYVIIETGDNIEDENEASVRTYEFYPTKEDAEAGSNQILSQKVKSGEDLYELPIPVLNTNEEFLGWYTTDGDEVTFGTIAAVEKTETIKVYAKKSVTYYVTYIGAAGEILAVERVVAEDGEKGTAHPANYSTSPTQADEAFFGWAENEGETDPDNKVADEYTVTGNKDLYPIILKAYWIHFYENDGGTGGGASYTGPVSIEAGQKASTGKPADPTRAGFTFEKWTKDEAGEEDFDWNTILNADQNLYAQWKENTETKYTIIVWKQKVSDSKDTEDADKTYDYETSEVKNGTTNQAITEAMYRSYSQKTYTGFHLRDNNPVVFDEKTVENGNKIRAKGDTVINVYFDRDLLTLNFYERGQGYAPTTGNGGTQYGLVNGEYVRIYRIDGKWVYGTGEYTYTATNETYGTSYGLVDGQYVELTRHGWGGLFSPYYWTYRRGNRDIEYTGTRYKQTEKTAEYTGTRYVISNQKLVDTYTGLYGQTLEQAGYTWKDGVWDIHRGNDSLTLEFIDSFIFDTFYPEDDGKTVNTYRNTNYEGEYNQYFYKETDDGWKLANTFKHMGDSYYGYNYYYCDDYYNGYEPYVYKFGKNGTEHTLKLSEGIALEDKDMYLYFKRKNYELSFSSNGTVITDLTQSKVPYGKKLTDYKPTSFIKGETTEMIDGEPYLFAGWYENAAGEGEEFDFDKETMPAANKVIYAKWEKQRFQVELDPNHGQLINAQVGKFKVDYGTILDRVSLEQNVVREGYNLVGWFDAAGKAYGYGKVTADTSLVAKWRKTGTITVEYDCSAHSTDEIKDNHGYSSDSTVVVARAPKDVEEGYAFIGWQIEGAGTIYYPNNSFDLEKLNLDNKNKVTLIAKFQQTGGEPGTASETVTITYDPNGGTGSQFTIDPVPRNSEITLKDAKDSDLNYTYEGHKFLGWALTGHKNAAEPDYKAGSKVGADNIDRSDNDPSNPDTNILYAIWAPGEYTIKYDINGGDTGTMADTTVKFDEEITLTENAFEKSGYEFDGWNTAADGSGKAYEDKAKVKNLADEDGEVVTLYAQWKAKTDTPYKVEFYYQENGTYPATATSSADRTGTTGETAEATAADKTPTKDGYVLDEAAEGTLLSGKIAGDGSLVLKIFFKQQFTVEYKKGDHGTFTETKTENLDYNADTPAAPDPTGEEGYEFGGWTPAIAEKVTADATYVAQWTANKDTKYTVEYYYQSEGTYPTKADDSVQRSGETGTTAKVTDADKQSAQAAFVFDENAANVLEGTIAGNGSLVLKVYFKQQFTVTYQPGEHGTFDEAKTENLDYNADTPAAPDPTGEAGYTFVKWNPTIADKVTADATYVAQWKANEDTAYVIQFYYQEEGKYPEAATAIKPMKGTTDTEATVEEADKTPTKEGYVFDETAANVLSGNIAGNGSLVLKVFFKQQFTVEYKKGDHGTFTEAKHEGLAYNDATPKAPETTGETGFEFDGWDPEIADKVTENAVYTAKWKAVQYTVIYKDGDKTLKTEENKVHGDKLDKYEPKKKDYIFDSWTPDWKDTVDAADANDNNEIIYTATWKDDKNNNEIPDEDELFTVIYDLDGGETTSAETTFKDLKVGDDTPTINEPTKNGFTFSKWEPTVAATVKAEDSKEPAASEEEVPQWEITYKAIWEEAETPPTPPTPATHTVTYTYTGTVPAGASALPAAASYEEGATVTVAPAATAPGYTFSGWSRTGSFKMPNTNVVITGSFTANEPEPQPEPQPAATYTVTYTYTGTVPAGASALPATASYEAGATVTVAPAATASGYTFSGWSRQGSFTMPASNVIITGSFTANNPGGGGTTPVTPGGGGTPSRPTTPAGPAPAAPAAPAEPAETPAEPEEPAEVIEDEPAPQAAPEEPAEEPEEVIEDKPAPRAPGEGEANSFWSLIDLLATIGAGLLTLGMMITYFGKKKDDEEEEKTRQNEEDEAKTKRRGILRLSSLAPTAAAVVTFILTQDLNGKMRLIDKWTILFVVFLAANGALAFFSRKKAVKPEQEAPQA
ncbi:MAG: hypothetical protein E7240_01580 [Lachnospiraceae bacterium]|nr:hypothetical protein [Lachnospiraceae bacterium]